ADVTFTDAGSERILPCWNSAGNQFNGNIIFNSTGSSVGINFCGNATAAATQAAGFGLSIGGSGFSAGYLILQRFTQLGNATTNLTLTATANYLQFGPGSALGGNVTSSSPGLYFNGCTFNGTVNSTKTGASNDASTGSNIFNGAATMTNAGSGQLFFGNGSSDQFNAASTFNNTGSNNIYVAWNSSNNTFGGVATFNNTPTANTGIYVSWNSAGTIFNSNIVATSNNGIGVQFCGGNATATATLAAGNTISIGAGGFSAGTLLLKQFTQVGATAQALTLTGTGILTVGPSSAFGGDVNFLSPQLYLNGCTYSGVATLEKNGATDNGGNGGNIFNGVTTITNSGSGYLLTGNVNSDQFNAATIFNNTGAYRFYFAQNHAGQTTSFAGTLTMNSAKTGGADAWSFFVCEGANTNVTFGGTVTMNCSGAIQSNCRFLQGASSTATFNGDITLNLTNSNGATQLQMGTVGTSAYNGNIIVTNSGGATGIYFNTNATASSTLANTKTITVGAGGFTAGGLYLYRFTQLGGTAQSLTLTGTANLTFGPTSAFGGNVTCSSPTLFFNGCTYSGTVNATKTGTTNDASAGNNVFNGAATMTNAGSGWLMFGNGNADQFNAASTFNNTGSANIYVADNSTNNIFGGVATFNNTPTANTLIYVSRLATGTTFNNNIVVTSTNGQGVQFCNGNATATAILSAGNTISIGGGGFSVGTLLLRQFTQVGATAQSLTLTGTGNLTFGPTCAFGGNVTSVSPTLLFNGCTFSGTTNCTKNGTTNDAGAGNNIFTGVSTMNNNGSGYLLFGNGSLDQWGTDVTFNNTGSNIIYAAYNAAGNTFGGNVTCNNNGSTGNNSGIYFCSAANSTASITGNLIINNNSASGTNNGIRICDGNGATFSVGGTTNITNTNTNTSNYIRFSNGTASSTTFSGDVTVTNNGTVAATNVVHFGYNGSSIFNGNITLNSNGGTGIYFGSSGGTSTQANNKTINTSTYTGGNLYIRNFTQAGPTTGNSSNVSITGTNMLLTFNGSLFYDNVTGSSQEITATNSVFNGTASLTKVSGNANDYFAGGNTFNGSTTITNQSTFILGMANGTADAYNSDVTFAQSSTGALRPNYNANCTYTGNITVTAPAATAITFGVAAGGIATMSGGNAQTINLTTGNTPIFTQFVMSKSANNVTLNTRINISTSLTMTTGNINTTSANILNMNNAATTTIGSAGSYINGPMNYDMALNGARTLNFPIGKTGDWRPVVLALTHNAATSYTYKAELTDAPATFLGWTLPATVDTVSGVHYWDIDRSVTNGAASSAANLSGNQTITIYFDVNDGVYQGSNLTICKNTSGAPTTWIDIGGNCALGNFNTPQAGSVSSTSAPSAFNSFSRFTLGSKLTGWNSLPVDFLYFTAKPVGSDVVLDWATASETNNDHFIVERSQDGNTFEYVTTVKANGNGNSIITQLYKSLDSKPYSDTSYYRLKQFDKNGAHKYSGIVEVNFAKKSYISVYPNPAYSNLTVEASNDYINATVKITNAIGEEVINTTLTSYSNLIDVSDLQSGFYFVTIDNGSCISKTKIMVQK
ncbi:MAG TPA: T9SS type A sorting domain-containing protein, partial [Bacteroidia bacterium]|nr:T9SS type A sorting domain-containing protein [Bacteroidia bacterium]